MKKPCLLIPIFFILSGMVFAEQAKTLGSPNLSGKELLAKIDSSSVADREYTLGFVSGVYGVFMKQGVAVDIPTAEKLVEIVKKYLAEHKDQLNRLAVKLVEEALKAAFPVESK